MNIPLKKFLLYSVLLFTLLAVMFGIYIYRGSYLGEEVSPNGEYSLRYYKTINPFKMYWSMPGGSACRPVWVRLYDKTDNKLKQRYSNDCALEMKARWHGMQLFLPDGETVWELPASSE